jgi:hypothetical protein
MNQRLKSWESPRRQGRNDKGKGGSARQRQLRKQTQMLRNKLKGNNQGKEVKLLPFAFLGDIFFEKYPVQQAGYAHFVKFSTLLYQSVNTNCYF